MRQILFAHPDIKLVQIYESYLKKHFSFDSAHDGLTALRKIRILKPHLIVSEYHLPLISGLSLLKFIRNHQEMSRTPFIFLTKHEDPVHALELGANEWILRHTASPDLVLEKIYNHIRQNHGVQIY